MVKRLFQIAAVACVCASAWSADLSVTIKDTDGLALADAVVVATPVDRPMVLPARRSAAIEDQVDKEFVPYVNVLLVGTPVTFPNSDNVRHHVYSFSPAKRFELPLYAGTPAKPVLFDTAGVVVIGCNIHDWMIAYVYVSESPYFAKTGAAGAAKIGNLPPGNYQVRAWHPRMDGAEDATRRSVVLTDAKPAALEWRLSLRPDKRARRAPVAGQRSRY
jgi:plastocyanin